MPPTCLHVSPKRLTDLYTANAARNVQMLLLLFFRNIIILVYFVFIYDFHFIGLVRMKRLVAISIALRTLCQDEKQLHKFYCII